MSPENFVIRPRRVLELIIHSLPVDDYTVLLSLFIPRGLDGARWNPWSNKIEGLASARFGFGSAWPSSARPGSTQVGSAQLGSAQLGSARLGPGLAAPGAPCVWT